MWRIGRISQLLSGDDNMPRGAVVKTSNSVLTRPIIRLYPIEFRENEKRETENKQKETDNLDKRRPRREAAILEGN